MQPGVRCIVCGNTGLRIFWEKILRHFAGESLGFFLWKSPKMLTMCFAPNSAFARLQCNLPKLYSLAPGFRKVFYAVHPTTSAKRMLRKGCEDKARLGEFGSCNEDYGLASSISCNIRSSLAA